MLAIFKNIKFLIGAGVLVVVLAAGGGLYFHGKKVESLENSVDAYESQIEKLEGDIRSRDIAREIIKDINDQYLQDYKEREIKYQNSISNLRTLYEQDQDARDYYNQRIPDSVRKQRLDARCEFLPYLCREVGGNEDSLQEPGN